MNKKNKINLNQILESHLNKDKSREGLIFDIMKKNIKKNNKILISISGWADSWLCGYLLSKFWIKQWYDLNNLFFFHANHKIRKESDQEEKSLKEFLNWFNLTIAERKNTKSHNEESLRNRRYEELNKLIKKEKIDIVVFWHHLNDRIESTFMNLLRWANLKWFISMTDFDSHHLVPSKVFRPILNLNKEEILTHCKEIGLPYFEDKTNKSPDVSKRNKLRNTILPLLFKESNSNSNKTNTFFESMKNIYQSLENTSAENENKKIRNQIQIQIPKSRNVKIWFIRDIDRKKITEEILIDTIKEIHSYTNITKKYIQELLNFLQTKESWYKYINWTYFFLAHSKIYIIKWEKDFRENQFKKTIKINKLWNYNINGLNIQINEESLLDWEIRFAKPEDKYKWKTRNQFCIAQKIPVFFRKHTPLIIKNNEIKKVIKIQ